MTTTPTKPVVEVKIDGVWVDVTDDVRLSSADSGGGISIERGVPNEGNTAEPTQVNLVLDNTGRKYSNRNPYGPYFGKLKKNLPMRIGLNRITDDFARFTTNGWGSSSSGTPWFTYGTAANFDVLGGVGTITATSAIQHVSTGCYADVDVTAQVKISTRSGTPEFGLVMRANRTTGELYQAYVLVGTTDQLRIGKIVASGGYFWNVNLPSNVVAGTWYWMKAQAFGQQVRTKFWKDGDPEPDWQLWINDADYVVEGVPPAAGAVGATARFGTGAVASFRKLQIDSWRAHVEITEMPPRWDLSRQDRWVPVQANGILRRLGQGRRSVKSAVTHHLGQYVSQSAGWWPLEEGESSRQASTPISGGPKGTIAYLTFDEDESLPGVAAVAEFGKTTSWFVGTAKKHTGTGSWSYVMFLRVPDDPASEARLATVYSTGTARTWRIKLKPGAVLEVDCLNSAGLVLDSHSELFYFTPEQPQGSWIALMLCVQTSGSNVSWQVQYHRPGQELFYFFPSRTFSGSVGTFSRVEVAGSQVLVDAGGLFVTQVFHLPGVLPFIDQDFANAASAYVGERAGDRWLRLCRENNVPAAVTGHTEQTQPMGPQRAAKLLELLDECAEVEDAVVTESRVDFGLVFRPLGFLYNQRPLVLSANAGHLTAPLEPVHDDQLTRNDVTVRRPGGSFFRSVQTEGPLNINPPEVDPVNGAGTYAVDLELNLASDDQLQKTANWLRARGTQDDVRFPALHADLTSTAYQQDEILAASAAGIDCGDLLGVDTRGPLGGGGPLVSNDPTEQIVRGYVEDIDQWDWDITWNTVPGQVYRVGVVGKTTRLDTRHSFTTADFDAGTDTALVVARDDITKALWVLPAASPGSFPFDVSVGGVRLRVTSVTGASDPQTMTVQATPINGVVKTIPAGSQVRLAEPWRMAR